jgi:hypothetical protein
VIPEVAFPQTVRVAIALLDGPRTIEELQAGITPETARPSLKIVRNAAEVLIRGGFAELGNDRRLSPNDRLRMMTGQLTTGELDAASSLWEEYPVYSVVLGLLKEKESVKPAVIAPELARRLNSKTALDRSERVWRLPVFLGQAWSHNDQVFDGSVRPDDDAIKQAFVDAFAAIAQDGLASLADLLPTICLKLRCAPWFCKRAIEILVTKDRLPEFSFQPSAGKQVVSNDYIVEIHDGDLRLLPSATDRLEIGARPVFTVIRAASA